MTDIRPLPIHTRLIHGETIHSYALRHSDNNDVRISHVEYGLRTLGAFPRSRSSSHPGRKAAWRALGELHLRAFNEPDEVAGNPVIPRQLCHRCSGPHVNAFGRRPDIGWVCLEHKRWIGPNGQVIVASFKEALVAQQNWRRNLAPRGIVIRCPVILLASEAAKAGISQKIREERSKK